MADSSFDIVSKVDPMELDNAMNQAEKELTQRYDFKGVDASLTKSGEAIVMQANSEERVKAVLDVLQSKLVKRGISLKSLETSEPVLSGKVYKINVITVANVDGTNACDITISKYDEDNIGGTAYPIVSTISVPADATLIVLDKTTALYLKEDESIGATAGTANDLVVTCSWEEINA